MKNLSARRPSYVTQSTQRNVLGVSMGHLSHVVRLRHIIRYGAYLLIEDQVFIIGCQLLEVYGRRSSS